MAKVGDETIRSLGVSTVVDPLVGQVVDSYKIEGLVGTGAMGMVYRGTHTVIGKAAAIKVLKPDYADDPEMVQRLVREARTVNAIRHPAIVDIFGFGTLPKSGQPYIIMDLLEGTPLDEYITEHAPMTGKQIFPFLDELLSALFAAHQVGVIHRDLKPGNVFIENKPDGHKAIKVIDFGLAKQADRAGGSVRPTNPGTLLGTPAFMAPEQVMGTKVTPQTDLYAVGGIAYQMLTKHLPHEAPSAIEVLSQKMQHDPIRPKQWQPSLDDELDAWVMNLLAREPGARMKDADEARKALRRIVEGRTQGAPGVSGNRAAHKPLASTGVVPRREWGEAKTVITESQPNAKSPAAAEKAAEQSTADHQSPWAKTNTEQPIVDDVPEYRRKFQSSRELALPTLAADPAEVRRAQDATPLEKPAVKLSPTDSTLKPTPAGQLGLPETTEDDVPVVAPPKKGLYVALGVALVALIGGLVWLIAQT